MRFILVFFLLTLTPNFAFSKSEDDQSGLAYENWASTVTRAEICAIGG